MQFLKLAKSKLQSKSYVIHTIHLFSFSEYTPSIISSFRRSRLSSAGGCRFRHGPDQTKDSEIGNGLSILFCLARGIKEQHQILVARSQNNVSGYDYMSFCQILLCELARYIYIYKSDPTC